MFVYQLPQRHPKRRLQAPRQRTCPASSEACCASTPSSRLMEATAWARLVSADTALPFTFCSSEDASCRAAKRARVGFDNKCKMPQYKAAGDLQASRVSQPCRHAIRC